MKHFLVIWLLGIHLLTVGQVSGLKAKYMAGAPINFTFHSPENTVGLIIVHAYGTTPTRGTKEGQEWTFTIPPMITQKKGMLDLRLIDQQRILWQSTIEIVPDSVQAPRLESYCGPKHLIVGRGDFTMISSTVLDRYDNPFPTGTPIETHSFIDQHLDQGTCIMDELIAFKRLYGSNYRGYGAISTHYAGASSKEFRLDFYTNEPENFYIQLKRQHAYADGLQLVEMISSTIQDRFGNVIENGTLVLFEITDSNQRVTIGHAETIGGVAHIKLPAPTYPTQWKIKASVPGYARSNQQYLSFEPSLKDLPFKTTKQALVIGPLKSFMGQHVREGLLVDVALTPVLIPHLTKTPWPLPYVPPYTPRLRPCIPQEQLILPTTYTLPTENGTATLDFSKNLILPGIYEARIAVGGLIKTLKITVPNE